MLLDDVSVSIPDADSLTFSDYSELLVESHHLDAAILVTDDALSNTVEATTIVSSTLANDTD